MSDNKLPVTIVMDVLAEKLEQLVAAEMENNQIGPDLMEFVLYKVIQGLTKKKAGLYSAEIVSRNDKKEERVEKSGTVDELAVDMRNNGVEVSVDQAEGK